MLFPASEIDQFISQNYMTCSASLAEDQFKLPKVLGKGILFHGLTRCSWHFQRRNYPFENKRD